jgi:hypothetical protein
VRIRMRVEVVRGIDRILPSLSEVSLSLSDNLRNNYAECLSRATRNAGESKSERAAVRGSRQGYL